MTVVWGDVPKKSDYYDPDAKHPTRSSYTFNIKIVYVYIKIVYVYV